MGLRVPPVFPVSVAIVEVFGVCCWEAESPRLFVEPGFFRTLDLHDHAVTWLNHIVLARRDFPRIL
jgi:hypothetical protein